MASLKIHGITKSFGSQKALDNVTLEIPSGTFVSFFGPPGAGKTTLLKVLAGLIVPDSGSIYVGDQDVTNSPAESRDFSFVFQSFALYPHMTVYNNIASPLKAKKLSKSAIDKKVKQVAEFLRIEGLLERKPGLLSGGEKQRVAIGRALAKEPEVYLFDEPLTNLDYKLREEMRGEFKDMLSRLGKTIVYATPDPIDALSMSDKIAAMSEGKLLQYGQVAELYNKPSNTIVASLMGYPAMNMIEGVLVEHNGRLALETSSFTLDLTMFKNILTGKGPEIILGLRPENVKIHGKKPEEAVSLQGKTYVAEIIGAETILHVKVKDVLIKVFLSEAYRVSEGEDIEIFFDLGSVHLFDKKTRERLV